MSKLIIEDGEPVGVLLFKVYVRLDTGTGEISYSRDLDSGEWHSGEFEISVPSGLNFISFNLDPENIKQGVTFPTTPVSWINQNQAVLDSGGSDEDVVAMPAAAPAQIPVMWSRPDCYILMDVNLGDAVRRQLFQFGTTVLYEGRIYGSQDPTVVNNPPPIPPADDDDRPRRQGARRR